MLLDNEFVIENAEGEKKCTAVAILYSKDVNRCFVIYDDGTKQGEEIILKFGEIIGEDDGVSVQEITNPQLIDEIWDEYLKVYNSQNK